MEKGRFGMAKRNQEAFFSVLQAGRKNSAGFRGIFLTSSRKNGTI